MVARTWARFDLVPNVTLAIVLVGGAYAVSKNEMTIGGLVAFVSLELMLIWPIDALGWIISNLQEAMTAADRIYEVLDSEVTIVDRPDAVALDADAVSGDVRFEDVQFTFPDATEPVLRGIDLDIRPGETMALVGATGSGKSALISLVPRLYDVTAGRITLDGHDIRDLARQSARSDRRRVRGADAVLHVGPGKPDAGPAGRHRRAGRRGDRRGPGRLRLRPAVGPRHPSRRAGPVPSGGQRQRLALARAVLGRPRVLVLDDPLSALDVHTEALVEAALARVLARSTALIVVHRPSTVALADRVALLQDGVITHVGTHSELLATVPAYRAVLSAEAEHDDSPALDDAGDLARRARRGTDTDATTTCWQRAAWRKRQRPLTPPPTRPQTST